MRFAAKKEAGGVKMGMGDALRLRPWAIALLAVLVSTSVGAFMDDTNAADRVVRGPSVDVRTRGAAGNGIADDTAVIQAALDAGADVILPSGYSFLVRGLVVAAMGQRVSGGGRLVLADGVNRSVLTIAASDVAIDGLEVDGNAARQTTASDESGSGI